MSPETFEIISKTIEEYGHRKAGKTMKAAKMVLVHGLSQPEACRSEQVNRGGLHRLIKKFSLYNVCECCRRAYRSSIS